eukprot:159693_1
MSNMESAGTDSFSEPTRKRMKINMNKHHNLFNFNNSSSSPISPITQSQPQSKQLFYVLAHNELIQTILHLPPIIQKRNVKLEDSKSNPNCRIFNPNHSIPTDYTPTNANNTNYIPSYPHNYNLCTQNTFPQKTFHGNANTYYHQHKTCEICTSQSCQTCNINYNDHNNHTCVNDLCNYNNQSQSCNNSMNTPVSLTNTTYGQWLQTVEYQKSTY